MSNKHFVITIERQYGSGGRLTGKRLSLIHICLCTSTVETAVYRTVRTVV